MLLLASAALAARPSMERSLDSEDGTVRVWYEEEGEDAVLDDDDDADGLPDFAEEVAQTASDVLQVYASAGFRSPEPDTDGIMDVFLVDFGGNADGAYTAERCSGGSPNVCSGYFVMENDFSGYGYGDLSLAIRVLTSHELFHAVQAAYDSGEGVWFSEGTAVWAEDLYDPDSSDFIYFCGAYLEDTGRSLDEPPAGPVPTFAYATALWWKFLSIQHGDDVIVELLEATESEDILVEMAAIEEAHQSSLADDWATFARWNLATGRWAGAAESYSFAARIGPISAEASGGVLVDENRFYPLAASYYKLEHAGGELWFATDTDAPELVFSLHAVGEDGVGEALVVVEGVASATSFGEQAAGDYWLVGTNPTLATNSTRLTFCLGGREDLTPCVPAVEEVEDVDEGEDSGGEEATAGCGCDAGTGAVWTWPWAVAWLASRRRRSRCLLDLSQRQPARDGL